MRNSRFEKFTDIIGGHKSKVVAELRRGPNTLIGLATRLRLDPAAVAAAVVELQTAGAIRREPGGRLLYQKPEPGRPGIGGGEPL